MVTCPWCGTSYTSFQSNCSNCGGPLLPPAPVAAAPLADDAPLMPPPPPRMIASSYIWRLITVDGGAIAGFVLALIGLIFTIVGGALSIAIVTAFIGIPFAGGGLLLLVVGLVILTLRYQQAQKILNALRIGEAVRGQIETVEQDYSVEINGRHPWKITYLFDVLGRVYNGKVTTMQDPGRQLQPGRSFAVLYLPSDPKINTLYPHP